MNKKIIFNTQITTEFEDIRVGIIFNYLLHNSIDNYKTGKSDDISMYNSYVNIAESSLALKKMNKFTERSINKLIAAGYLNKKNIKRDRNINTYKPTTKALCVYLYCTEDELDKKIIKEVTENINPKVKTISKIEAIRDHAIELLHRTGDPEVESKIRMELEGEIPLSNLEEFLEEYEFNKGEENG